MSLEHFPKILVCHNTDALAIEWAEQLNLTIVSAGDPLPDSGFAMRWDDQGLALQPLGKKAPGAVRVDFTGGSVDHRRKFGGGSGQMIAKAVGVKVSRPLTLLDATAGMGKDAFVLASLGCQVRMQERNPIVAALLSDGLRRGGESADAELREILQRMSLEHCDSLNLSQEKVDVVYLDPMFPERSKSASVKKDMAVFHTIVGRDEDADGLLSSAINMANYRVVVKRPRKAPFLNDQKPGYQLSGKTSRYDVYVNAKLPD